MSGGILRCWHNSRGTQEATVRWHFRQGGCPNLERNDLRTILGQVVPTAVSQAGVAADLELQKDHDCGHAWHGEGTANSTLLWCGNSEQSMLHLLRVGLVPVGTCTPSHVVQWICNNHTTLFLFSSYIFGQIIHVVSVGMHERNLRAPFSLEIGSPFFDINIWKTDFQQK